MESGTAATRAKNKYKSKAYDRIELVVPKGHKATVQAAADKERESINNYVNKAVLARMGLEEWPESCSEQEKYEE